MILGTTVNIDINTDNTWGNFGMIAGENGSVNFTGSAIIENCSVNGTLNINATGAGLNLGGICGENWCSIKKCFNKSNLTLNSSNIETCRLGGISGVVDKTGSIENCYNNGNILLDANASKAAFVGGVTGVVNTFNGFLKNVYNIGSIKETVINSSSSRVGSVLYCCGQISNNLCSSIYGLNNLISTDNSLSTIKNNDFTPKSTSELSGQAGVTLLNKDNDEPVWVEDTININNGYPILNWQVNNNK